jgi:multiple sugar transport system substrate-binding protein
MLGAAATGAVGLFGAAGLKPAMAADQKLVFWSQFAGSKKPAGDALEAAFKKAHPEVDLQSSLYADPVQLNEKILTAVNGNTAPDLFVQHWDYTLTYASGNKMLDLKDKLKDVDFASLDHGLMAYGQVRGGQYSIPMYGTSRGIGFNRKLVQKAGLDPDSPPKNWQELRDWAKAMTERTGSGLLHVAGMGLYSNDLESWELFTLFLQGAGGQMLSNDLKSASFAGPEGVEALTFLHDLIQVDKVTDPGFGVGPGGLSSPFNQGREAMIIAGNYSTNNALKAGIDFDVAPIPKKDGGFTSIVDPFSYAIPAASPDIDAALKFIGFALSPEQQVAFCVASKNVPVLKSAQQDPQVQADKYLAKFVKTASYAPDRAPAVPGFSQMVTIIARAVQECFFDKQKPEAALKGAADQVQAVLDQQK